MESANRRHCAEIFRPLAVPARRILTGMALVAPLLLASSPFSTAAQAEQSRTLSRIAADGVIRAGTRANAAPFARQLGDGTFEGVSVDLLEEIRRAAEGRTGRPVRLELSPVTPADRLQRVAGGELDIVCGITTPTWDREEMVDFSLPFFRDGTRVLVYRENAGRTSDLGRMQIAVVEGTTTVGILRDQLPSAELRVYPDMNAAMGGLEKGEVGGVANVGIVLLGLAAQAEPRRSVVLLPRTRPLATETLACVLPQNDSIWRDLVNRTLVDLFDGVANFRGRYVEIYERWFGRNGRIVYPLDRSTRDYLGGVTIWAR